MVKSRVTTINNGQYGFISVRMRLNVKDLKYSRVYGKLIAITPFLLLPSCVDLLHVLQCIFTNTFQKKRNAISHPLPSHYLLPYDYNFVFTNE